jgi:hypothetical protein
MVFVCAPDPCKTYARLKSWRVGIVFRVQIAPAPSPRPKIEPRPFHAPRVPYMRACRRIYPPTAVTPGRYEHPGVMPVVSDKCPAFRRWSRSGRSSQCSKRRRQLDTGPDALPALTHAFIGRKRPRLDIRTFRSILRSSESADQEQLSGRVGRQQQRSGKIPQLPTH